MTINGTKVNQLPTTTPILTDIALSTEVANPTILKRSTWQGVYDLFKGVFDTVYGNPDFYQYSIVRTVSAGNLTVALKNYEGNDPTPTKPVKIMIGGVVRTITSALNKGIGPGVAFFNAGSAELATKEIDYFTYLSYNSTDGVQIGFSRIPYGTVFGDFSSSNDNEKKYMTSSANITSTDPVVNIGRFNATLSAGAGYTWSIPATSVIVNSPIYETRWLVISPTIAWTAGTNPTSPAITKYIYKVSGDSVSINYFVANYSGPGINVTRLEASIPFSINSGIAFGQMCGTLNVGGTPNATNAYIGTASVSNCELVCTSVGADRWGINGTYFI